MGHCITGLVAAPSVLTKLSRHHPLPAPVPLNQGLAFLPLRGIDLDAFLQQPQDGFPEGFNYLSAQLIDRLLTASRLGPLAYVEMEYFAGAGIQGAAVFRDGKLLMQPVSAGIGPVNLALGLLGVRVAGDQQDAFEAIGLYRHRHTEEWVAAAG
ncbi:MAG: hypothetical protein Q7T36_14570 [Fluviicoccus sp.]|uniref:hypothetical protein n=1 Tax=Fluviicoccus sp. TaxID=2003552 RepID=UPI0027171696|nr:hypothetical protein [Fluviicoccus sp.]MDO8331687.1 hypothetical protein [Fluviicoccus sp.]